MIRATNQSGVFYMGSRPFRPTASAEYGAMPLAFGLDSENTSGHSRQTNLQPACKGGAWNLSPLSGMPSDGPFEYTRQTFGYTAKLAGRGRVVAGMNKLCATLATHQQLNDKLTTE